MIGETFVDPEHFSGTLYTASVQTKPGQVDGAVLHARDFYVRKNQPKRLLCRELAKKTLGAACKPNTSTRRWLPSRPKSPLVPP